MLRDRNEVKMKKNNLLILGLAFIIATGTTSSSFGESTSVLSGGETSSKAIVTAEPASFSVTVPTQLTVAIKSNGDVIGGAGSIINGSAAPIKVNSISVKGSNGWNLVSGNSSLVSSLIDSKKIGFTINDSPCSKEGNFVLTDEKFPQIDVGSNMSLKWGAVATGFEHGQTEIEAATITFIIGFAK